MEYSREPANALSNLGFMVSGLLMFKVLSDEKTRDNQRFYGVNKTSGIFAAAVIYLGPGSMLMHGTHRLGASGQITLVW